MSPMSIRPKGKAKEVFEDFFGENKGKKKKKKKESESGKRDKGKRRSY